MHMTVPPTFRPGRPASGCPWLQDTIGRELGNRNRRMDGRRKRDKAVLVILFKADFSMPSSI